LPVVLFLTPAVVPVTVTENVQLPPPAIDPPLKAIVPGAVVVREPPHAVTAPAVDTVNPTGKVSLNATPVKAVLPFGFVIVKLSEVVPPTGIEAAPKVLVMLGGPTTVVLSLAVSPVPPFVELTLPVVLFCSPAVAPVTVTANVHVPPAATVAPPSEITPVAAVVVRVPPH
jgi:hypothetical protein